MEYRFIFLCSKFFEDHADCPEIEKKPDRPHLRILMEINGLTFAIPFRSHISHPHAFITDKENSCGLDFSKAVILKDPEKYIDKSREPRLRQNEFNALKGKSYMIEAGMLRYIRAYIKAARRPDVPRNAILLRYSTLQYFPDEILLPEN